MFRESLRGIRVLDFTHIVAGPVCTMTLADLGADVVKVEPLTGEIGRRVGPPWLDDQSVISLSVNRNKRSLAIDLKSLDGKRALRRMISRADVLVESFRPGVMRALGLGHASLSAINPALVYCSISAFGQESPARDRPGVDGVMQAVTGLMSTLGHPDSGPAKVQVPVADMVTGYLAAIAVLAALREVRDGKRGQHLDVSLYNATIMLQQVSFASFLTSATEPKPLGSAAPYAAPNEALRTADGWIMVAAYDPKRWAALCRALDAPGLPSDPRFATNADRVAHRTALRTELNRLFSRRTTASWLEILPARDILCAPVAGYREVVESEEYRSSGVETTAGGVRMPGFVLGPSQPAGPPDRPAPRPGQHSAAVLAEYGLSEAEVARLDDRGVIGDHHRRPDAAAS
ncbi:crotonobetainyl-CoA:carnitine CoA-transferase CaiB-like acyl-CoA transferase [Amycolatopsis endophytica]|uniref:Crotonobetainyl-CoA:carnitine CoA-transferase CaiB-like acyl-CoA transferase n=1 Tax=Amycolatopsis endophytica TaxID=860233 RepID=A0A853BAI2_9PSEU|nr:CoA transferase [Amycolatopsis endophytica]NYI91717.1 crotonobetainyl-CoA:carnitine CoA-transferase CaiB-like acyl-CoA transferase [Amycolatopsis endophytica]